MWDTHKWAGPSKQAGQLLSANKVAEIQPIHNIIEMIKKESAQPCYDFVHERGTFNLLMAASAVTLSEGVHTEGCQMGQRTQRFIT